jgi:hypothetical protein
MPPLPAQHKKKEADFGVQFRKWWTLHPLSGEIELKYARNGKDLPFSEVSSDQVAVGLMATSKKGVLVRRSAGTTGGADYSGLVQSPYWIVVKYTKHFYIISLETFLLEKNRSTRKSLTEERARAICVIEV